MSRPNFKFKVYRLWDKTDRVATQSACKDPNSDEEYVAACNYADDAAAICIIYGPGSTIKYNHKQVLYKAGVDGCAGDSCDEIAEIIFRRLREFGLSRA